VTLFSCAKKDQPTLSPPVVEYRHAPDVRIDTSNIAGIMLINNDGSLWSSDQQSAAWAWFYNDAHSRYIAMQSKIAGIRLRQVYPDSHERNYVVYPTYLYTLNLGSSVDTTTHWELHDSVGAPLFSFEHAGVFPTCSGVVPANANWSAGLMLTIDTVTVKGADSIYILIRTGSGISRISKTIGTAPATVNIDLSTINDNTSNIYATLTAFTYTLQTFNGKTYAFIKQNTSHYTVAMTQ